MSHTVFVVSHTHWDREWYLPFEEFRTRLVELIDELLDILSKDEQYRHFTLDGQTIVLEDYLAVRRERRADLERHIRNGRILVGPWYVLPDEFLVSPEALIRNLMVGHSLGHEFGPVMEVGYTPDPFGHIGQLPQILQGFGIKSAVLERGLADEGTELRWQASDGTEVLLVYLRDGYDNAALLPVRDPDEFKKQVNYLTESLAPHGLTECVLLLNGTDHMEPQPELPGAIGQYNAGAGDETIIHGTLPSYVDSVRRSLGSKTLPTVQGELRQAKRFHLLPGVLSTRMYIKQRNHACQTLLVKWAEPFAAFAQLLQPSASDLQDPIRRSWRYLLQNHAHDSICGCSVDQVHREMITRFDQSQQIAESVTQKSLETIVGSVNTSSLTAESASNVPVVVFNPMAGPRTDVVELAEQLTGDPGAFAVHDPTGEVTPGQIVNEGERSTVLFLAQDVPGHGYKTFFFRPGKARETRETALPSSIENEFYRVEVEPSDGTLVVTDKETGTVFAGLNSFVDGGDRGDEYNYCAPEEDTQVSNPSEAPTIAVVEVGPVRQTLQIRLSYRLPVSLTEGRRRRLEETVEIPITSRISLYPGVKRIDIHTTVTNHAHDHRLRVHFPTPWRVESSFAESAFDVVERPVDLPMDTNGWIEQPVPTHPQATFADLSDGHSGLMVANKGLPEYEAFGEAKGTTIALTLLRCVGWLSRDDLNCRRGHAGPKLETPEAQCLGTYSFHYALIPHMGDWRNALNEAYALNAPLRGVVTDMHAGTLRAESSFVKIRPSSLTVSAIKNPEEREGLVVRFHNTEDHVVKAEVCLLRPFDRASLVNLNEDELRELPVDDQGRVSLPVRGKEIVTLRFDRKD
jgi:mannosylglycerate hydrolase